MSDTKVLLKSRRLERTSVPGVYKRGDSHVVVYRDPSGRQRKRAVRTVAEGRAFKSSVETDVRRGEFRERSHVRFADFAPEWCSTYAGRTSRGFREGTRASYLRGLGFDEDGKPLDRAATFFRSMKLAEIEPRHVKRYLQSLADAGLAPSSIRRLFAPLRAMLQDATEDGIVRFNVASGVRVPASAKAPEPKRKDLEPDELERLRGKLGRDEDRLLVDFLLATGVRVVRSHRAGLVGRGLRSSPGHDLQARLSRRPRQAQVSDEPSRRSDLSADGAAALGASQEPRARVRL